MGMTSALKLKRIVENAELVLAIELMAAAQGLDYRAPLKAAVRIEKARIKVREYVARLGEDRVLSEDIEVLAGAVRSGEFNGWAEA